MAVRLFPEKLYTDSPGLEQRLASESVCCRVWGCGHDDERDYGGPGGGSDDTGEVIGGNNDGAWSAEEMVSLMFLKEMKNMADEKGGNKQEEEMLGEDQAGNWRRKVSSTR